LIESLLDKKVTV